jgi:septum formation protein
MSVDAPFDLVLASASPRRRELLERVGLRVRVFPVDLDERVQDGERPDAYVRRLAGEKCDAAVARLGDEAAAQPVLAADTTVILGGQVLGKPEGPEEAAALLGRLAGRRHEVTTAYRVRHGAAVVDRAVTTAVTFRLLTPAEIAAYVASREWDGKAGGYAVQGIAAAFVTDLRGSPTSVIGLPLAEVLADLRAAGGLDRYPPAAFGGGA